MRSDRTKEARQTRDLITELRIFRSSAYDAICGAPHIASYERMVIAARTRAALRVKKLRGERVGAVPLGYRLSADVSRIEPDSGEQEIIALVRQLRGDGLSLRQIDVELRARGHRPRGGGHWHVQTLANILRPEAVACAV